MECMKDLRTHCPSLFAFPTEPFAFGHLRFVYTWNQTFEKGLFPEYVCYSEHLCGRLSASIELRLPTDPSTSLLCQPLSMFNITGNTWYGIIDGLVREFQQCSIDDKDNEDLCRWAGSFRCGKKCISKHRLVDSFKDCLDNSDETFNESCALNDKHRRQQTSIIDGIARCYKPFFPREESLFDSIDIGYSRKQQAPHFPTICDGYTEFEEGSDTDETDCHEWQCDNQYTRCDFVWNCPNGQDEARCSYSSCKDDEHPCLSINTTQWICLPLSLAGDGIVDCWGATDERQLCPTQVANKKYLCRENQMTSRNTTPM